MLDIQFFLSSVAPDNSLVQQMEKTGLLEMLRVGKWMFTLLPSRKLPVSLHFGSLEAQGVLGGAVWLWGAEMDVKVQGGRG